VPEVKKKDILKEYGAFIYHNYPDEKPKILISIISDLYSAIYNIRKLNYISDFDNEIKQLTDIRALFKNLQPIYIKE
jgi:hypothetical protein